jgi:hypothetical protein
MDVLYFLKERTKFIRSFHASGCLPFQETIRKIEAGENPFEPPYSEDGEPPFMGEWLDASTAMEVLGRTCLSMLSESLKLYFMAWEGQLWVKRPCAKCFKKSFESGFLEGYRSCFEEALKIDWDECPADLSILEQVTLARNRAQHPESITTLHLTHDAHTRKKYPQPFFMHESEKDLAYSESPVSLWLDPTLHVSHEKLSTAIDQVELLADWLEERMLDAKYPLRNP